MASPGDLVKTIADVLGVPEVTVMLHDRALKTAGLRSKGGRGRSAAKMKPLDAANLLIGVAASSMIKDTAEVVLEYGSLPFSDRELSGSLKYSKPALTSSAWDLSGFNLPSLQKLPANHTFSDTLVALLEAGCDGTLLKAVDTYRSQVEEKQRLSAWWEVETTFYGPTPQASVSIRTREFHERHLYAVLPSDTEDLIAWAKDDCARYGRGDLSQTRRFTARTILSLGNLLKA